MPHPIHIVAYPGDQIVIDVVGQAPAPVSSPPPAPATEARWPVGKGMFIWQLKNCAGGDPAKIVAEAQRMGFKWLAVKGHDGKFPFNGDLKPLATALRQAGINMWAWGYTYGREAPNEALMAAQRTTELGCAGYIIDAEGEYEKPGMAAAASAFAQMLRDKLPTLPIGLCSYRYPRWHLEFPWREFLAVCDFHAPQLYWLGATAPGAPNKQLVDSLAQLRALKDVPVVPAGVACRMKVGDKWWEPSVEQLNNFHVGVLADHLPGETWWSWEHAEENPQWWAAIAAHQW